MKTVPPQQRSEKNDMDFLARSFVMMERSGRGILEEAITGNMTSPQQQRFAERVAYWRQHLTLPEEAV
ncbi:hypothetical protein [Entomohabitans teleogrylli]|uniref:hypothetical protein n=1 Tax=Entomohabitans teleogrylli TaxID=1384589 RepID=UPI00073D8278|nr:hypothetical protein [Entomohabitans teleogrylli]